MLLNLIRNKTKLFSNSVKYSDKNIEQTYNVHSKKYPVPILLNFCWSLGFLGIVCLIIQIVSGIFLFLHYNVEDPFWSVHHIMRDVPNGWFMRYTHAINTSMFFVVVDLHLIRGLFYKSYIKKSVWVTGVIIFLWLMAVAFLGYTLPWTQMSYWGATVITKMLGAIPFVGDKVVSWIWGGPSVTLATLGRIAVAHFVLGVGLVAGLGLHLLALHTVGSGSPFKKEGSPNIILHLGYTFIKDIFILSIFFIILAYFIHFQPHFFSHPENYIPADPMVTPKHIQPEWYFLPFYAILRSIPNKGIGVLLMFGSIIACAALPWLVKKANFSAFGDKLHKIFFFFFLGDLFLLGVVGAQLPEAPFIWAGRIFTFFYFFYFLVFLPGLHFIESKKKEEALKNKI